MRRKSIGHPHTKGQQRGKCFHLITSSWNWFSDPSTGTHAVKSLQPWWRHQMEIFSALLDFVRGTTGHRWIPLTKARDAKLWCLLWSALDSWANNRDPEDMRHHRAHYDVTNDLFGKKEWGNNQYSGQMIHFFYKWHLNKWWHYFGGQRVEINILNITILWCALSKIPYPKNCLKIQLIQQHVCVWYNQVPVHIRFGSTHFTSSDTLHV